MKVIIINGRGGCGKDTFIKFFAEYAGEKYVQNISTVDYIKDIARRLGWKEEKDNQSRKYLVELKEMATYWADIPFNDVMTRTRIFCDECIQFGVDSRAFVFIHCREPEQIQRLVDAIPYPTCTLLIRRRGLGSYGNHSDDDVENYNYDYIIENNYNLDNLKSEAIRFCNKIKYS